MTGRALDRAAPAYRAAVVAVVDAAGTPDGATIAGLRVILASPLCGDGDDQGERNDVVASGVVAA